MPTNILNFCQKHKIKTLPINLAVGNGKKTYLAGADGRFTDGRTNFKMTDFQKLTLNECVALTALYAPETEWIAIDTTDVQQLDIDDPTFLTDKEAMDKVLGINEDGRRKRTPHFLSITKKCPHYFIHVCADVTQNKKCWHTSLVGYDHDVLSGQWSFAQRSQEVIDCEEEVPVKELPTRKTNIEVDDGREKGGNRTGTPTVAGGNKGGNKGEGGNAGGDAGGKELGGTMNDFQREVLDNIHPSKYYDYHSWLKFIWAIRYTFAELSVAQSVAAHYSAQLDNFQSEADVLKYMSQAKEQRIGWGYLMRLSKMSNRMRHFQIIGKHTEVLQADDYNLGRTAINLVEDNVVKTTGGQFYIYKEPYWVRDANSELRAYICTKLREYCTYILRDLADQLRGDIGREETKVVQEKIAGVQRILKKVNTSAHSKSIADQFSIYFEPSDIDFDTYQPYYFCFTNVAFDLRSNQSVVVQREDYITQTTGYPYIPAPPVAQQKVEELVSAIFPECDDRLCYISILRTSMIGIPTEKFILANGAGGNGKGLINELLQKMLGRDYFYKASITTIVDKMRDGPNPAVANMHKKRCVLTAEPRDDDRLNLGIIKQLTGGNDINARGLYQSSTVVKLMMTLILECNKKPKIDGRVDDSVIRRFINVFFKSLFTDKAHLLQLPGYFAANPFYKTDEWQDAHRCALFDFLMRYDYTTVHEPKCIQQSTYEYLCENDDFTRWLDDHFAVVDRADGKPDPTRVIKLREMCALFKEKYLRQGSREYRQMTADKFLRKLQENIKWKHIVRQRYKERSRSEGSSVRMVFVGMQQSRDEDEDATDDEVG